MKTAAARERARSSARNERGAPEHPRVGGAGFVVRFLAVTLAGVLALALFPGVYDAAGALTARQGAGLARLLGLPVSASGIQMVMRGLRLDMDPECTPLVPILLVAAAMLGYPATAAQRVIGVVAIVPLLWVFNLFRVVALIAVLDRRPGIFEFVHVYLWQAVTLAACAASFALWLRFRRGAVPR